MNTPEAFQAAMAALLLEKQQHETRKAKAEADAAELTLEVMRHNSREIFRSRKDHP